MKAKYSIGLLAAIIVAASVAVAQQPAPPPAPPDEPLDQSFSILIDGGAFLGIYAENVSRENMSRYHMNQVRGVGVTQVVKDSPAEKAGLRKDDVILRIDGENVTSVRKLNRLVSELAPDQNVKVTFSRGGAEQEVTATIAKRNNQSFAGDLFRGHNPRTFRWEGPLLGRDGPFGNDGNFSFDFGNSRRIGVSTMQLTKQLADYFGITSGKGVLVTTVVDDGPAAKAGVKAGDVITAIEGEAVDSPGDLSRVINRKKEGDVSLTIIRNKAQQTIRVTPREGSGLSPMLDRADIGRRIVIPRIEIPMPAIDISLPRIRVTPRPRIRTVQRPI